MLSGGKRVRFRVKSAGRARDGGLEGIVNFRLFPYWSVLSAGSYFRTKKATVHYWYKDDELQILAQPKDLGKYDQIILDALVERFSRDLPKWTKEFKVTTIDRKTQAFMTKSYGEEAARLFLAHWKNKTGVIKEGRKYRLLPQKVYSVPAPYE